MASRPTESRTRRTVTRKVEDGRMWRDPKFLEWLDGKREWHDEVLRKR